MEQDTASFWRAFTAEENEQAHDVLTGTQIMLSRSLIPGVPIILSEGQYRRVVIPYDLEGQVATIHYLVDDGRIHFLSIVLAVSSELCASLSVFLGDKGLCSGIPVLPKEFEGFLYASGWRDLVTREADAVLVRNSLNPFPRTQPIVGGTANR